MQEFLNTHLDAIIGFFAGGGLLTVITASATKKQAEANAMKDVQSVYQETIKDLRAHKDTMRDDNNELRGIVESLEERVKQNSFDIERLKEYKCTVNRCANRRTD